MPLMILTLWPVQTSLPIVTCLNMSGVRRQPVHCLVFLDPIVGIRVILEFVNAEPIGRMIERIDRGPGADGAERAHGGARDKTILVHARIFAYRHVRPELGIAAEIERAQDFRANDFRARKNSDKGTRLSDLVGEVFDKIDINGSNFIGRLPASTGGGRNAAKARTSHKA